MKKIIKVLLTSFVVFSMFSCNQASQTTKNSLIGEWVADEVPAEIKEITLSITDSHFVIKTTESSGEVVTITYKYTNDDSNIYATSERVIVYGKEETLNKGQTITIPYILKNNVLSITVNGKTLTFHRK